MLMFLIKRFAQIIPVIFGVTLVVFLIMQLVPGDPAIVLAGEGASKETIETLRQSLGLNNPLYVQYLDYVGSLLQGDFGHSLRNGQPVLDEVMARLPITIELAFYSILITIFLGLIAGVISAIRPYSWADMGITIIALLGISLPSFWLGILLIYQFSVKLGWFPVAGWDSFSSVILPAITLGAGGAAIVARMTR
ncbi:MAG: ABC transporter permease, partial [Kurthia sp.]